MWLIDQIFSMRLVRLLETEHETNLALNSSSAFLIDNSSLTGDAMSIALGIEVRQAMTVSVMGKTSKATILFSQQFTQLTP